MKHLTFAAISLILVAGSAAAGPLTIIPSEQSKTSLEIAPAKVGGRVIKSADGSYLYQWPGVYFETSFRGSEVAFDVGPGDVILEVFVDGMRLPPLVKPKQGLYRVDGLPKATHTVRIEVASESQASPNRFDGFFVPAGEKTWMPKVSKRAIEFIGDSHTVGYGNISDTRDCTTDQVWATTDNTQAFGPITAHHYNAEYRINAISGRGVVRNYNGFSAPHLPEAYPNVLLDGPAVDSGEQWQPQAVVVALGTNDFSTPLNSPEKWKDREELRADYEATYSQFLQSIRLKYPKAQIIVWSTELFDGEIKDEAGKVVSSLRQAGDNKIQYVLMDKMEMSGCHSHPSIIDSKFISSKLIQILDDIPGIYAYPGR